MTNPIELVKKAVEFRKPEYLPLELVDVPGLYDAYDTLDRDSVRMIPGAEGFDSLQTTCHWTFREEGRNEQGERLRRDEWGCLQRVPTEMTSAYAVLERPLASPDGIRTYRWPSPAVADPFFYRVKATLDARYRDRFICGYIDPGPFLIAFNLMGYDGLLMRLVDDPEQVVTVIERIMAYQRELVKKWKAVGAHMVCVIDEFAGTGGLMFSPEVFRQRFKPMFRDFLQFIRDQGLYTGLLLDGNIACILDDVLRFPIDLLDIRQPHSVGIDAWAAKCRGRVCLKASVDMMTTLAKGAPEDVRREADELVRKLSTPEGGFMGLVLRWHRPEYPAANVRASVEAFNRHRR